MRYIPISSAWRVAALLLLIVGLVGPWFYDIHPATQAACAPPLVWLGGDDCACLVILGAAFGASIRSGPGSFLWLVCLLPGLPILSTLLILLGNEQRWLKVFHMVVCGLLAAFSFLLFAGSWFSHKELILWGAGLYGAVSGVMFVGEWRVHT